jgi:hypothetical protein
MAQGAARYGNFLENPYDKLEMLAPQTIFMQAKTYYGGGLWYTLDLDYDRIAKLMRRCNYRGFISLEFEAAKTGKQLSPKPQSPARRLLTVRRFAVSYGTRHMSCNDYPE